MTDERISISLTPAEYRELLLLTLIGTHVRNDVLDNDKAYVPERHDAIERGLLATAGMAGLPFVKKHENHFDAATDINAEYLRYIDDFVDDSFWEELEVRLGKRDFERSMTDADAAYIAEHMDKLPPRVSLLYKTYRDELDKYGIDRLEINKFAPVVSDLI